MLRENFILRKNTLHRLLLWQIFIFQLIINVNHELLPLSIINKYFIACHRCMKYAIRGNLKQLSRELVENY